MSTYQSASYWQFRIVAESTRIYILLQPDDCARRVLYRPVYETASSSQIDKLTSTITLSFIILLLLTISLTVV